MTSPVAAFAALGDDTRWSILVRLGASPASASTLAQELPISRQAIVKHLDILRGAGLVAPTRRGREIVYAPLGSRISSLGRDIQAMAAGWDRRLRRIKELAEE